MRYRWLALGIGVVLAAAAACDGNDDGRAGGGGDAATSAEDTSPTAPPNPSGDWEIVDPTAVGLDAEKLEEIASVAEAGKSNCLVVVRDGKLAGEWYFRGTDESSVQETMSVSKSFASTLVGIAQADGDLDLDDSASTWIPEWRGTTAEAVTVRDLLSNSSGREWRGELDVATVSAADATIFSIGLEQTDPPDTMWVYNNPAIQTLERVMEEATDQDVAEFAEQRLFEPLGMTNTTMTTDAAGNAFMFLGVQSTCQDLARLGVLMLNGGQWDGEQVLSGEFVEEATGQPSTELNAAYGYLWWLNHPGTIVRPLSQWITDPGITTGPLYPSAPADMFWALGAGNQVIQVDPESKTVVVRLGILELQPVPPTFGQLEASTVVTRAVVR